MMTLKQINNYLKREDIPLFYVFFKVDGEVKNIIFQEGSYYTLIEKDRLMRLNPLSEVETAVNKVISKEYELVGKGYLKQTLPVNNRTLVNRREHDFLELETAI